MNGRLRIGACLSLSGKFAQFGRQSAKGLANLALPERSRRDPDRR